MTWSVWHVAPFITSIFFVLGVFTLYQVLFDWIKSVLHAKKVQIDDDLVNSWFGVIYMLIFIFAMQASIVGKTYSWQFMNFIVIGLIFCAYFLNIHIPWYLFVPIVLVYMVFNSSIGYWQSWLHALSIMLSYWSFNKIRRIQNIGHRFVNYMLTGIFWGAVLWFFVAIKFSLSMEVFLEEWFYLIIFEILLFSYVRMLLRESRLRGHLVEFANHDALTKAQNYAAYDSEIKYLFANSRHNNLNLSMMMFDIDRFKHVNDTYGHLAGDQVLKNVAETVQTVIDATDPKVKLYRTGGEEFNVIFPGYDLPSTEPIVREMFAALNHMIVNDSGKSIDITISMGVSSIARTDVTPNDFYARVDKNLYHSKKNGRMQITAA